MIALTAFDETVVAVTGTHLLLSEDAGGTWRTLPNCPASGHRPSALGIITRSTLDGYYAVAEDPEKVHRFTRSGCTSLRNAFVIASEAADLPPITDVRSIVVHPDNPNEAWLAGVHGIWHTTNRGRSFRVVFGAPDVSFSSIALDPFDDRRVFAVGVQCPQRFPPEFRCQADEIESIVLRTDNRGATWQNVPPVEESWFQFVVADPRLSDHWYLAARQRGLFESFDGQTWKLVTREIDIGPFVIDESFLITPRGFLRMGETELESFSIHPSFTGSSVVLLEVD